MSAFARALALAAAGRRHTLLRGAVAASLLVWADGAVPPGLPGRYDLATVDGQRLPMVWHAVDLHEGGQLQMVWTNGHVAFRDDSTFLVVLTWSLRGPQIGGSPEVDTLSGTWTQLAPRTVRLRYADGRLTTWESVDGFRSVTLRIARPDLDGERRVATLVFVRSRARRTAPFPQFTGIALGAITMPPHRGRLP